MTSYREGEESLPPKESCQRADEWEQKMKPILTQEEIDALLHGLGEDGSNKDNFYPRLRAKILGLTKMVYNDFLVAENEIGALIITPTKAMRAAFFNKMPGETEKKKKPS